MLEIVSIDTYRSDVYDESQFENNTCTDTGENGRAHVKALMCVRVIRYYE